MCNADKTMTYEPIGGGPSLFRMTAYPPVWIVIPPGQGEPTDPPPYLLTELAEDARNRLIESGFANHEFLVESGVTKLVWRQEPRHIEKDFISDEVFQALDQLAPGIINSRAEFEVVDPTSRSTVRSYHWFEFRGFPEDDPAPAATRSDPWLVLDECEPPIPPDYKRPLGPFLSQRSRKEGLDTVLAIASWAARDDKVMRLGRPGIVTSDFVKRWKATPIAQYINESNHEQDFYFTASNGGFPESISFRWVEGPVPESVEL